MDREGLLAFDIPALVLLELPFTSLIENTTFIFTKSLTGEVNWGLVHGTHLCTKNIITSS
jgi:hypothetical protein